MAVSQKLYSIVMIIVHVILFIICLIGIFSSDWYGTGVCPNGCIRFSLIQGTSCILNGCTSYYYSTNAPIPDASPGFALVGGIIALVALIVAAVFAAVATVGHVFRLIGREAPSIVRKLANLAFYVEFGMFSIAVLAMAFGLLLARLPTGVQINPLYACGMVILGIVLSFIGFILRVPMISTKIHYNESRL